MWTNDGDDLYLNGDRTKVVAQDDPEAAFLLVASGGQLPLDEAEKYGLTGEKTKAKPAPDNKAKSAPENKSK